MSFPEAISIARELLAWYEIARRDLPWRRTSDPYRVWVSEIMLQQTTVKAVVPYYTRFLKRFPTVKVLARARLDTVLAVWSGLGYYKRARDLHSSARIVVKKHSGRFPGDLKEALALPGVGRYTAGAVLSIAYDQPVPILDGNVSRVLSRLVLWRGDPSPAATQNRLWGLSREIVRSSTSPGALNQALMELGAIVCVRRDPDCQVCPLQGRCAARRAGVQNGIPPPRRRRAPVRVTSRLAVVVRRGRYLMRRRSDTGLLDDTWEFPAIEDSDDRDGLRVRSLGRIGTVRHVITYRRMTIEIHRGRIVAEPRSGTYRWVDPSEIDRLPSSSLVGKVIRSVFARGV